jgi:hypothetical protein
MERGMKCSAILACLAVTVISFWCSQASAETVQTGANVFNGRPYLYVEAESYASVVDGGTAGNGWEIVSKESPINSGGAVPLPILPANTNASGTALLDDLGGGHHEDTALYEVKFITAGTYQFYTRHSRYNADANTNYGNEDSMFMSPEFNKNSASDWVGFNGLNFDELDLNADIPIPGFAVDPDGWKPGVGNHANDGWTAIRDWGVKSAGVVTFPNSTTGTEWNGNFNWYNRPFFVDTTLAGGFESDFGFKTEYIVTPDMVGDTLTFEIGSREHYGVMDGFLFIQVDNPYPNNDLLDIYTQAELDAVLPQAVNPDYNGDGTVDAADYVQWRKGESPDDTEAGYDQWKANFGETSPGAGSGAVPEPTACALLVLGLSAAAGLRRRRCR